MDEYEFERAEIDALERVVGDPSAEPISLSFWLLRRITNDFSDESEIGEGGFSKVYLGVLPSGSRIAVKRIFRIATIDYRAIFEDEVFAAIRIAHHMNIVRTIGYCSHTQSEVAQYAEKSVFADVNERLICMEYVPNGTLDRHITDKFHGGLDWNQRYKVLKGICHGLRYLHDEVRLIHGDIKA